MGYDKTYQRKSIPTLEILALINAAWELGRSRREVLNIAYAHLPWKILDAKLEHLANLDLIDGGVSIYQPWLTAKGRAFLDGAPCR